VAFSEIEDFLDTPVKRYSSGMYVRLAFAVAAHLEPEILIVDEVLAVGDAAFQSKCIGKMSEVAEQGRTVLFVTHNMGAVSTLCRKGLLIQQGRLMNHGDATTVVQQYLALGLDDRSGTRELKYAHRAAGDQRIRFLKVSTTNEQRERKSAFEFGAPIRVEIELTSMSDLQAEISYSIKTSEGYDIFTSSTVDTLGPIAVPKGNMTLSTTIAPNLLRVGRYYIQLRAFSSVCCDLVPESLTFDILPGREYSQPTLQRFPGHLYFKFGWSLEGEHSI
jgi:lipopolysaccharide transport system ATP-binding protein